VIATIPPLAEFAEKVGGSYVEVMTMIPPGASPHTYEPTTQQLKMVSRARLYVKVGAPIEFEIGWLEKLLAMNKEMPVVNASKDVTFLRTEPTKTIEADAILEHGADPHVWLSPKIAIKMVKNIYEGLIMIGPGQAEYFLENAQGYICKLDSLDKYLETVFANTPDRKFIVYHPAWTYFAHDYGLEQIAIEHLGKEPSAKQLEKIIEQARAYNIKVIFASPQSNTRSAEMIADEINGKVALIDPLKKNYIANMKNIGNAFAQALE
jgi:zinc transport system substrate-binding protein